MSRFVVLDAGPLAIVTQRPGHSAQVSACQEWLAAVEVPGISVCVPEIADYEVRRELLRAGKLASVARLDALCLRLRYLPISTESMRMAADLWAQARQHGVPTASPDALDADVILAAQALSLDAGDVVVATTNPDHLSRFVIAQDWARIRP